MHLKFVFGGTLFELIFRDHNQLLKKMIFFSPSFPFKEQRSEIESLCAKIRVYTYRNYVFASAKKVRESEKNENLCMA